MSKGEEVLAQLKFDSEVNIANASSWSDEEISEMMDTYLKGQTVAKETKNTELLLILNEKISQLEQAVELKSQKDQKPSISRQEATL